MNIDIKKKASSLLKDIHYVTIPALEEMGGLQHFFTTRKSGLGARKNGIKMHDDWSDVADAFAVDADRIVTVSQVHGEAIMRADEQNFMSLKSAQADALITNGPGIAIAVETADCVPVLILDAATPAVAAVHAGWRSTIKKIVQKTVQMMHDEFGSKPSDMIAGIGPAIGPECYEVDEPVMGPVREMFPFWKNVTTERGDGRWGLDLVNLNRIELVEAGLSETNVHSLGLCTSCRRDLFYSFRAEGRTGRMLSVVMIK